MPDRCSKKVAMGGPYGPQLAQRDRDSVRNVTLLDNDKPRAAKHSASKEFQPKSNSSN